MVVNDIFLVVMFFGIEYHTDFINLFDEYLAMIVYYICGCYTFFLGYKCNYQQWEAVFKFFCFQHFFQKSRRILYSKLQVGILTVVRHQYAFSLKNGQFRLQVPVRTYIQILHLVVCYFTKRQVYNYSFSIRQNI